MMADAYRCARMHRLEKDLFNVDRLGLYASLWQQARPVPSVCVYLFDRKRQLLSLRRLLLTDAYAPTAYCPLLPAIFWEERASLLALSVCAQNYSDPRMTDVMQLSRASLFCEEANIPVLDMILLHEAGYIPLSRMSGGETLYQMKLL